MILKSSRCPLDILTLPSGGVFYCLINQPKSCTLVVQNHLTIRKGIQPNRLNPFLLLVPGTRIELVQAQGPRDFKSLASTSSATQAPHFPCDSIIPQLKMQTRLTRLILKKTLGDLPETDAIMITNIDNLVLSLPV
jgi:hypothetical protein